MLKGRANGNPSPHGVSTPACRLRGVNTVKQLGRPYSQVIKTNNQGCASARRGRACAAASRQEMSISSSLKRTVPDRCMQWWWQMTSPTYPPTPPPIMDDPSGPSLEPINIACRGHACTYDRARWCSSVRCHIVHPFQSQFRSSTVQVFVQ